ncbi:MAG: 4Fe-4S dicluster domain-containing protein [Candidatus Bathyarchaeota archaeon]|nr:4Fe-4S dicluster domain-containing protein [Candidatus Bathyarchaeota archaeon]MDH5595243.1 4Fe-4S dicluster domain-containing protein [Candidatus Bathyarchaeota archaeon]
MAKIEKTPETKASEKMVVKSNEMDPRFKYEISEIPGAEKVMLCFQCGTCTADCPISRFDEFYRPRKLIRMTQLGLKDKLLSNDVIWLCSTCFTCIDHCPQDVGIASIVRALRNLTVERGRMPGIYKEQASNILKTGYAYVISDLRLKKRQEKGLPSLPKANLEGVAKLFDVTGFSKTLEKGEDAK